jgi:hypothetical protein
MNFVSPNNNPVAECVVNCFDIDFRGRTLPLLSAVSMTVVEAITESEHPLVIVLQPTSVNGVSALQEVVRSHVGLDISSQETG